MSKSQKVVNQSRARCPTCDMFVDPGQSAVPFCSERCRLIDLGRWLNEEIALPCEHAEDDEKAADHSAAKPRLPPGWHDA